MQKNLYKTKNTKENKKLAESIESRLSNLKNEIKHMFEDEIKINLVRKILDLNYLNQERQELKILTPDQMLSRLSVNIAQLKAVNYLQELKNEIKQLLYSLYRSKKLTKRIYKQLVSNV